jgi:hypothetical protein
MRRTFSKEKRIWTNVRLEEVTPIIGFLLAGIVVSVVELLLERVIASRTLMKQQRNVFCCIAAIRYIDGDHPAHLGSSEINVSQQVEDNRMLGDLEHPVSSHIV